MKAYFVIFWKWLRQRNKRDRVHHHQKGKGNKKNNHREKGNIWVV
ncbi:hypothetical protein HanXRQr2_Chr10g0444241 [Helianthus annuus]|uniref:Uncharacterized protein n=1 Tax=Helianthus annuus TaxID=4232 RepID=A0A9K3N474_HELAN|nr:hypothetical protein HanXRQr2_Chr10g0444241 [Helianthus annuus]